MPVGLVDVLPTLRELLTLPSAPELPGTSFAPALFGLGIPDHRPWHPVLGGGHDGYHVHAVTTARHKLVWRPDRRWRYINGWHRSYNALKINEWLANGQVAQKLAHA